jgi:hypothetical protein
VLCAIGKAAASARTTARTSRERARAALAVVVITLVTAVGCAGPGAGGATPQAGSDGGGHALEQDFTRVVRNPYHPLWRPPATVTSDPE